MKSTMKKIMPVTLLLLFGLIVYGNHHCINCRVAKDKMRGVKYIVDPCIRCIVRGGENPPPKK